MTVVEIAPSLIILAQQTRQAAQQLAVLPTSTKNQVLEGIAQALEAQTPEILAANERDCEAALRDNLPNPLYRRLKLDAAKLRGAIAGVRDVARLPDPVGQVQLHRELDTNLILKRATCPLGVIGVIFESRRKTPIFQSWAMLMASATSILMPQRIFPKRSPLRWMPKPVTQRPAMLLKPC